MDGGISSVNKHYNDNIFSNYCWRFVVVFFNVVPTDGGQDLYESEWVKNDHAGKVQIGESHHFFYVVSDFHMMFFSPFMRAISMKKYIIN